MLKQVGCPVHKNPFFGPGLTISPVHPCVALFNSKTQLSKKLSYSNHEIKICPRCRGEFECQATAVTRCQCSGVLLSPGTRELISKQYEECLCKLCLAALGNEQRNVQDNGFAQTGELSPEGTNFAINEVLCNLIYNSF